MMIRCKVQISQALFCVTAALALALPGCSSANDSQASGDWQYSASSSLLPALVDFTNQVPQKLVEQVSQLRPIQRSGQLAVIQVGKMTNETKVDFQDHFQVAMARLGNNLVNAAAANSQVRFVDGGRYTGDAHYHLTGQLRHNARSNTDHYDMQFQLTDSSGNVVWTKDYPVQ